jgi:hypothetical protein
MLNPANTICVVRTPDGKEVGRIAATAKNASEYLQTLATTYKECQVTYEEDADAAMISRMLSGPRFF